MANDKTSRKLIVTHDEDDAADKPVASEAPASSPRTKKIIITPLHDDIAEEVAIAPKEEPAKETSEPVQPTKSEPKPVSNAPVVDDQKGSTERAAHIHKLVTEGTYVLPIETAEERRSKRTAIIGTFVIVALLLAWYNVALDAQLLPNTLNLPHTGFFGAN